MRKLKVTEMNRLSVDDFKSAKKIPLIVILDNVRSMYNVGSIFRTCDAFRIEAIWLCGITGRPPHPEIHKTALGAEDSIEWMYFENTEDAVSAAQEKAYKVYSVEQCEGSTSLEDFDCNTGNGIAVILGNEVKGVQQTVVNMCDGCIEIPQYGTKHSLNVASAGAIVIYSLSASLCQRFALG
ncbi:MAG: RNA methyltransferase [Prevotella sp.]|nr:RNA methyltransferase [Candidatus Equicola stercoris]